MIIQSSQIAMSAKHQSMQLEEEQERLRYWHDGSGRGRSESEQAATALQFRSDKVSIEFSQQQFIIANKTTSKTENLAEVDTAEPEKDLKQGWKLTLIRRLVEQLTGKQIKIVKASDFVLAKPEQPETPHKTQTETGEATAEQVGWGLEYHYQHSYHESEHTSFSAQGLVLTADGKEIAINVELNMSRSFTSHESIDIRAGDALKDPLVINYSGTAAQLEETDLHFDLDLDGHADQLKFVSAGSGFLALDKNSDGQINDGSELFGPSSGDGFTELAAYDSDGNNWIDENDPIYEKLRIWERDTQGNFNLLALGQHGIGAIYLEQVETPFSIKDQQNQLQGQIRSSGLFLHESGLSGTVQQLDLVV